MFCIVLQVQRLNRSATLAQNVRGKHPGSSSCVFPAQADQAGVGHGMTKCALSEVFRCVRGRLRVYVGCRLRSS